MNEEIAKITIELNAEGKIIAELAGQQGNLLTMLMYCLEEIIQGSYCCDGHLEIEKAAIAKAILEIEAPKNKTKSSEV